MRGRGRKGDTRKPRLPPASRYGPHGQRSGIRGRRSARSPGSLPGAFGGTRPKRRHGKAPAASEPGSRAGEARESWEEPEVGSRRSEVRDQTVPRNPPGISPYSRRGNEADPATPESFDCLPPPATTPTARGRKSEVRGRNSAHHPKISVKSPRSRRGNEADPATRESPDPLPPPATPPRAPKAKTREPRIHAMPLPGGAPSPRAPHPDSVDLSRAVRGYALPSVATDHGCTSPPPFPRRGDRSAVGWFRRHPRSPTTSFHRWSSHFTARNRE